MISCLYLSDLFSFAQFLSRGEMRWSNRKDVSEMMI